jgi:putative flippase GtrA
MAGASLLERLTTAWHERAIALKAISFALVGVVNTLVDAGVFFLAYVVLSSSPVAAGALGAFGDACHCGNVRTLTLIAANSLSWLVAVSGSYAMNSFITFAAESGRQLRFKAYLTFLASGLIGAVGNTATLVLVAQVAPVWVAKACAILVSFVINFSMSHFVVFRARHPRPGDAL